MNISETVKLTLKKAVGYRYYLKLRKYEKKDMPLEGKYGYFRFIREASADAFVRLKKYNDRKNLELIRKKDRVRVGIVVYTSSMWNVDELYHRLKDNEKVDCDIILAHLLMKDEDSSIKEYNKTLEYFNRCGYKVVEASTEQNPGKYDILFYLTPYAEFIENWFDLNNTPLDKIVLHTSYSYMLAGNSGKLDLLMYHVSWAYYTDSEYYKKLIEKSRFYTGNAKYFGFPKMDQYYRAECKRRSDKKIIVYAPHHSVNYAKYKSATFEDNYLEMLKLAEKYSKDTYWIYKPHPLLRTNCVDAGLFKTPQEYDEYENRWNSLDNAEVVTSGDYFEVFKESDAMITDSISFLAEYQFSHKPLLLLESGKEKYNEFGQSIVDILYRCGGKDFDSMEKFINNVIAQEDDMYDTRMKFFAGNLEYARDGETANNRIYEDIIGLLN